MGTLASQYVYPGGTLRLNLSDLIKRVGPDELLEKFNELEQKQYVELNGSIVL